MLSLIKKTSIYSLSLKLKKLNTLFFNFTIVLTIILTPSIFLFNFTDVFEFPKILFLSICLSLLSISALFTSKYVAINKLDIIFFAIILIFFASSLFSKDFFSSLFGYFGNSSSSILFFLSIVIFLVPTKRKIKKYSNKLILNLLLISSIFPVFYGLLQIFNLDTILWKNPQFRVFSSFGQPNFFAIYLSILIFACLALFNKTKKVGYIIYFFALAVILFYTYSLSSFLSLFMLLALFFILFCRKNKKIFITTTLVIFLCILLITLYTPVGTRIKEQLMGLTNWNERTYTNDTAKIRLILWVESFKQTLQFPQFIWGRGNANYAYNFMRPEALNTTSEWKLVFTRPHNYFIEVFFEGGILVLIFYIYLLIKSFIQFKNDPVQFLPLLALINSFFLWFPAYIFYIFYLFFYKNSTYKVLLKINKNIFILSSFCIFLFSLILGYANYNYSFNPCLSNKLLLNTYQPYHIACALSKKDAKDILQAYKKNIYNKTEIEKIGLYFLNNNVEVGKEIFTTAYTLDKNNPVFLYYVGFSYELSGNTLDALKYYNRARVYSHNFYENTEAIERLTSY